MKFLQRPSLLFLISYYSVSCISRKNNREREREREGEKEEEREKDGGIKRGERESKSLKHIIQKAFSPEHCSLDWEKR